MITVRSEKARSSRDVFRSAGLRGGEMSSRPSRYPSRTRVPLARTACDVIGDDDGGTMTRRAREWGLLVLDARSFPRERDDALLQLRRFRVHAYGISFTPILAAAHPAATVFSPSFPALPLPTPDPRHPPLSVDHRSPPPRRHPRSSLLRTHLFSRCSVARVRNRAPQG